MIVTIVRRSANIGPTPTAIAHTRHKVRFIVEGKEKFHAMQCTAPNSRPMTGAKKKRVSNPPGELDIWDHHMVGTRN